MLLGTQAGPPIVLDRVGISTAVVVDGRVYLIDCGRASATQYIRAGLELKDLAAVFLTHLHADHVADLYNYSSNVFIRDSGIPAIGTLFRGTTFPCSRAAPTC